MKHTEAIKILEDDFISNEVEEKEYNKAIQYAINQLKQCQVFDEPKEMEVSVDGNLYHKRAVLGEFNNEDAKKISDSMMEEVRKDLNNKETKVIYLNEEDRPKIEEPLSLVDWFDKYSQEDAGWHHQNYYTQNEYAEKWLEYRNNFKPNDKPIEFEKVYILSEKDYQVCHNSPSNMDLVIVLDKETFIGIKTKEEYAQWRFKGNLNNGKVK